MAGRKDPVIVAPDQIHPDEWMVGDMTFIRLGGQLYELTVSSNTAPKGLDFNYIKGTKLCDNEVALYLARVKAKATPEAEKLNAIWDAVAEFSKQ